MPELAKAVIAQLKAPLLLMIGSANQAIRRLDITVDDAQDVELLNGKQQLLRNRLCVVRLQVPSRLNHTVQTLTVQLERNKVPIFVLEGIDSMHGMSRVVRDELRH